MEVTVKLNNIRRSPTKIRPTLYLVRGRNAAKALDIIRLTNKGCAEEIYKLIKSAMAAAKEREMNAERLFVKEIKCDGAGMFKRHRYGSRGRVVKILKRNSHLTVTLSDEIDTRKGAEKSAVQPHEEKDGADIKRNETKTAVTKAEAKPSKEASKSAKTIAKKRVKKEDNKSK